MSTRTKSRQAGVPRRVVARRSRGYKAVHRPARWGNPYKLEEYGREQSVALYRGWLQQQLKHDPRFLEPLRGYNLGCFCPLDVPCHADVILEFLYGAR
jgi:hypothetical protein